MFQIPTKVPRQEAGLKVGNQPYGCFGLYDRVLDFLSLAFLIGHQQQIPSLIIQGRVLDRVTSSAI